MQQGSPSVEDQAQDHGAQLLVAHLLMYLPGHTRTVARARKVAFRWGSDGAEISFKFRSDFDQTRRIRAAVPCWVEGGAALMSNCSRRNIGKTISGPGAICMRPMRQVFPLTSR